MWTASIHDFKENIDSKLMINKGGLRFDENVHNHDVWELSIVTGGTSIHHVEDKVYPVKRGEVFTIIPSFSHYNLEVHDFTHYNILFDLNQYVFAYPQLREVPGFQEFFITEQYQRYRHKFVSHLSLSEEQLEFVCHLCDELCQIFQQKKTGYRAMVDIYFIHLLTYLSNLYIPSSPKKSEQFHNIEQTIIFIETNYNSPIQVADLAKISCLSERQYTRLFQRTYGITPMQYVIRCRLDHARTLISTTSFSIAQIAEQCGFFDKSAFTKLFKKTYQLTPGEYRRFHVPLKK